MRGLGRFRIDDDADRGVGGAIADQRAQHAGGVGVAAGAGIILGIGNDNRLAGKSCRLHRKPHAIIGREDAAVEIAFMAGDERGDPVRGRIRVGLGPAIGEHARAAVGEIGGRKTRRERQRRHRVALKRGEFCVNALAGFVIGALPGDRNQERDLPERLGETMFGAQQQRKMPCGGGAGVGHIDMRVGAIGDQRVRLFDHLRRHIGVQIETDHQRQIRADHLAHARNDFALAIVDMLGDHGAMQIEINRVDRTRRLDAIDDRFGDAFIGVLRHMRRRARGAPDGRHQLPAHRFGGRDEAGDADIDVAQLLEQFCALAHRRPAAAMYEVRHRSPWSARRCWFRAGSRRRRYGS